MNKTAEKFSFAPESGQPAHPEARVRFDAKGNSVYQGSHQHLLDSPLMTPELRLQAELRETPVATRGYDPYDNVSSGATTRTRKLSMQELSKWIELKKRLAAQGDATADDD